MIVDVDGHDASVDSWLGRGAVTWLGVTIESGLV